MRWFRWLTSIAFLTSGLIVLTALDSKGLAPPPLSLRGVVQWAQTRDAIVAVFALVRVGALLMGGCLLVIVVVGGAVATVDEASGRAILDRLSFGLARGLLTVMGLGALPVTMAPVANAQSPSSSTAEVHEIDPVGRAPSQAVIRPLLDQPAPMAAPAASLASDQYVIAAGDSLWSVAATHLQEVTGRADLTETEIAVYWRAVVDANPLPNPDLLFIDQVIELPTVVS